MDFHANGGPIRDFAAGPRYRHLFYSQTYHDGVCNSCQFICLAIHSPGKRLLSTCCMLGQGALQDLTVQTVMSSRCSAICGTAAPTTGMQATGKSCCRSYNLERVRDACRGRGQRGCLGKALCGDGNSNEKGSYPRKLKCSEAQNLLGP